MRTMGMMLLALLVAAPVSAKTLYVNAATGSDTVTYAQNSEATPWRSLGRAMWGSTNREARNGAEAAKAGDLVLISGDHSAPGTNRRNDVAFISENSGTAGNPITYRAVGRVRLSLSSGVGPVAGVYMRHYIVLDGFTVEERSAPSTPDTGPVAVWDATNVTILNFTIDANSTGHNQADNHPGLRIEAARDVRVAGTRIFNVRTAQANPHNGACIQTYGSGAVTIENNELYDCGSGVFVKGGPARYPNTGFVIRNNLIRNIVGGSAITLHAGAIGTAANPIRITGNVVRDSDVPAVRIWGFSADPLNTPMNVQVSGNTFVNVRSMLLLDGAVPLATAGHLVERNIVVATYLPVEWDSPTSQAQAAIRLDRNLSPSSTWATVTSGARYTLAQWRTASGQDANSVQADPRFVSGSDLRLQTGSPAAGLGAYVTGNEVIGIPGATSPPPPPPPAPVDCVVSAPVLTSSTPWSACSAGSQTRTETWSRTITTSPANGGAACPALTETRSASQACTGAPPPPPPPPSPAAPVIRLDCEQIVTVTRGADYANGEQRWTIRGRCVAPASGAVRGPGF